MRWFGESPALPFFGEWEFSLLESPLNSMYRRSISGVIIIYIVAVGVFESKSIQSSNARPPKCK